MRDIGANSLGEQGRPRRPEQDWPLLAFLGALVVGIIARVAAGRGLPLGFDETFTATIASQPNFAGLLHWCLTELSGPAFYMPMWIWAKVAGVSDAALRAPALAFSIATPLMIARFGHGDRNIRLWWAALTLLWLPDLPAATEARPYAQMFFLGTVQAIMFLRLAAHARPWPAFWWGTATALAVLTHSYALAIGGCQGLALLAVHRKSLVRLWPMAVPLAVMLAWMIFHLPHVLQFMASHLSHYEPNRLEILAAAPIFVFGHGLVGYIVLGSLLLTRRHWWVRAKQLTPCALLGWTGLGAAAIILLTGQIGSARYLIPAIPALLFGMACWLQLLIRLEQKFAWLIYGSLLAAMLADLISGPNDPRFRYRRHFEVQTASKWILESNPKRLHFLWLSPTGLRSEPANVAEVVGFYFRRAGQPVEVAVERPGANRGEASHWTANPNGNAILWLTDVPVPASMTPDVPFSNPDWECKDFGGEGITVYACRSRQS